MKLRICLLAAVLGLSSIVSVPAFAQRGRGHGRGPRAHVEVRHHAPRGHGRRGRVVVVAPAPPHVVVVAPRPRVVVVAPPPPVVYVAPPRPRVVVVAPPVIVLPAPPSIEVRVIP